MVGDGMRLCWAIVLCLSVGIAVGLAGCTTVRKTFDFSADPELERPGTYPNINVGGAPQPGTPLTAEEQEKAKADLAARGQVANPALGADAKRLGADRAAELDRLAKSHGEQTLKDIQNGCGTDRVVDATKCPQ